MLRIGICTNRIEFKRYVKKVLGRILQEYDDCVIEEMSVQDVVEKKTAQISECHILCIDEKLFQQQGLDLMVFCNRMRPDASIFLLEGVEEQGLSGVRYHLFAYHMQRMRQTDLLQEIVRQWKKHSGSPRNLNIVIDGEDVSVSLDQIMYIESNNRHVILHTLLGDCEYSDKMYVLEELLKEDGFVRCHQSYIVSRRYVTDYNSLEIYLGDVSIPIGRKYKQQVYDFFRLPLAAGQDDGKEKTSEKQGVLCCESGTYKGTTVHFCPEQNILIGRDAKLADIVVNLPKVSRLHCVIVFHEQDNTYEIVDVSKNGTYIDNRQRLVPDTPYVVKAGTKLFFGDFDNVYYLG